MKNILLLLLSFCMITASFGQKKLIAVTHSSLTGLQLPAGSKQDSRMFSTAAAKMLLEIEGKKAKVSLSATEVLALPASAGKGFNTDSLLKNLADLGWTGSPVPGDKKYAWLQKENRHLLLYFSGDAKETDLYFAKASSAPQPNSTSSATAGAIQTSTTTKPPMLQTGPVTNSGFTFNTTNFNDGWNSSPKEDWVEVTKGNFKVLLHYPNKRMDGFSSDLMTGLKNAWDVLVAPKYSRASNMEFKPLFSFESIEYAEADMIDKATGKEVHVVLFKKLFNRGTGRYIEFISLDKNAFEKEFGRYTTEALAENWNKMANMITYNKFAVAPADLNGKWTSNFTGMTQYVNAYTGANAGANTHASNENFEFGPGNTYKWDLGVASGFVGNIKFQSAKSNGGFSLPNNWQVAFSDIEGKPRTYNVQFVCIKGARVLWIGDTGFGKKE